MDQHSIDEYEIRKNGEEKWFPLPAADAQKLLRGSGAYDHYKKILNDGAEVHIPPDKMIRRKA